MEIQYKLLIIDDSPTSLLFVARTVETKLNGVKVFQAQSAREGFTVLEKEAIDLILMDVQMPEMNGFEATKLIQQNPNTFHIPIIFLTAADPNLEYMPRGLDAGAIDYLTKPISDKELVRLLSLYFRFIRRERAINAELDAVNKRLLTEIDERKDIERELQVLNEQLEQRVEERTKALALEVSDRELAEDALRDSEMKYRLIFDNSPVGILHFRFDSTISACNKAFAEIIGAPKERLIGFNMLEQVKNEGLRKALREALRGQNGIFEGDYESVTGKKKIVVKVIFRPLLDDEEMVIGGIGIISDISDTKKAEDALKRSEAQFRSVWLNSLDGMRITDEKGTMIMVNAAYAKIFGKRVEDFTGVNFTVCYASEEREYYLKRYIERFNSRSIHEHIESEMKLWNGDTVYLELLNSYLGYSEGESPRLLTIVRDISDRKRSELEMQEAKEYAEAANLLKSNLLANMSHEFRTPLNGILGFASILEDELEDDESMVEMVVKIQRSGQRLMKTLNSILELSYLETPMQEFTLQEIDLSVLFRSVLKNYENLAQSKNLQFNFTCNEESILIAGHEELLKRVFENLMDNAVKYTEKGSIHISIEKQQHDNEGFAVIGFKDTGIGIEKDKQEIIFQEFRQVSEGFGRSYEGTGLGLTLVLKIMKLMGGTITVNSTPGEGSLFSVWIPLVENGKDKKEEPKKFVAEPETSDGARKRLLLVEDNKINEEITVLFLQGKYDIESVNDGKKALAKASENEYDAFLLDIHLDDDMSGVDVAEGLRKMDKYKETPIVAITGYAMAGDREFLLSSGFTHYLAKPFQKEELLEVVGMVFKE